MFKFFNYFDRFLVETYSFIIGFRLSDWEIGQLILMELNTFHKLSKLPKNDDSVFRLKTSALRLFAWAHKLGFVHFTRGLKCLVLRFPEAPLIIEKALSELVSGIPLDFDEGQYLDHRYFLSHQKFFGRSVSLSKSSKPLSKQPNFKLIDFN